MRRDVALKYLACAAATFVCFFLQSAAAFRNMYEYKSNPTRATDHQTSAVGRVMHQSRTVVGSHLSAARPNPPGLVGVGGATPDLRWRPLVVDPFRSPAGDTTRGPVPNLLPRPVSPWNEALNIDLYNEWTSKYRTTPSTP